MPEAPCPVHPNLMIAQACVRCGDFGCWQCISPQTRHCKKCRPAGDVLKPDLGVALGWVMKDPQWLSKVLVGALCLLGSIVIVPMFLLMGYQMRIIRREHALGAQQVPPQLPGWDNAGELLADGAKFWVVSFLSSIVPILVLGVIGGIMGGAVALSQNMRSSNPTAATVFVVVAVIAGILLFVGYIGLIVWLTYAQPALHIHYIRTGSMTCGLDWKGLWRIITFKPGDYFNLWLYDFVANIVANFIGQFLCLIGIFATIPWAIYTQGFLIGKYMAWLDTQEPAP